MALLKSRWNAACSTLGMSIVMGMFWGSRKLPSHSDSRERKTYESTSHTSRS